MNGIKKPMSIRISEQIQEDLKQIADSHGISVNAVVNMILISMVNEIKSGRKAIVSKIIAVSE